MSTSQTTASFYSVYIELPVFDAEVQKLIEDLDHLNNSIPLDYLLRGGPEQNTKFDPYTFAVNEEDYLSLYDLCSGDPTLVDNIRWRNLGPSITFSTTTPPLVVATPSPTSDDFTFPPPTVGGKWIPGSHPRLVPTSSYNAPSPLTPATSTNCPATPGPASGSSHAGPSRSVRSADNIRRHQPYRKATPALHKAWSSVEGRRKGRKGRIETRDYLGLYPANVGEITRPQGYRALIREGRWGPLVMDALKQIGVPYPTKGLQKILSELYDGEGEQEGIPEGTEGRPALPWRVSFKPFLPFKTVSDNTSSL